MTLLEETKFSIEDSGHTESDITFIGSQESGHSCSWDEFKTLSDKEYDSGFGAPKVATDLIIVFSDGAKMWRGEYDGSEWWNYSTPFEEPAEKKPINRLFARAVGWQSLAELNNN